MSRDTKIKDLGMVLKTREGGLSSWSGLRFCTFTARAYDLVLETKISHAA